MKEIFLFELQYRLRRPVTWIYVTLCLGMGILAAVLQKSVTAEFTNSPNNIIDIITIISILSIFFYAAIMGVPIFRDKEHHTAQTYFTFPISQKSYVLGRFLGSFAIASLLNICTTLGVLIGFGISIFLDRPDYGTFMSFHPSSYLLPFFFILQINALLVGALFFCLMAFFKKMPIIYLGGILLFILYSISGNILNSFDNQWLSVYLDPFGGRAFRFVKKYWSINELNSNQLPIYGKFLLNRLIWLGIAFGLFFLTLFRFNYKSFLLSKSKKQKTDTDAFVSSGTLIPTQKFDKKTNINNLVSLTKIEFLSIVKDPIFSILLIIGGIIAIFTTYLSNKTYETPNLPLTRFMVEKLSGGVTLLAIVILIIYAGEAVHRTRKNKTFVFYDALPIKNTSLYLSKILSLSGIAVLLVFANILLGLLYQTFLGYTKYELGMYFTFYFTSVLPAYLITLFLAFFIHVIVNNKFLGHFIIIAIYIGLPMLVSLGFKSNNPLLLFGNTTPSFVSDLNGFGHYLKGTMWMNAYWLSLTLLLVIIGKLFWTRGFFSSGKERLTLAKNRFSIQTGLGLCLALISFIAITGFCYYNLKVLNKIHGEEYNNLVQVEAEKKYSKYLDKAHPQVTDLKVTIDLFPKKRSVAAKGIYTITNNYPTPIDTLFMEITYPGANTKLTKVTYNNTVLSPAIQDSVYRVSIYKLPKPLLPGTRASLVVEVSSEAKGFANQLEKEILYNGSFINSSIFPRFYYERSLVDNGIRRKHGLEKLEYLFPPRTDSAALKKNLFNEDANYLNFEATISTVKDQIAIAPGILKKQWTKDERAYYQYQLESPTDLFFNVVSASYDTEKANWISPKGKEVAIEIYHSPKHKRNLKHFINGVKAALDYCSKNFYEYPNSVIRIVEFPAYATFAQSFATTIPYSEDFGFVADFDKAEDFNYAFRVTTHEVAHQWWGHIVTPSKTSGANIISETLAEYTSLMTMKHEYGEHGIKNFLKYSLDSYLRSRSFSLKPERSLLNVEIGQHIWYRKGSMIMYELQDLIGEEKMNQALQSFLMEYKYFEKGVYPTSENLYHAIRDITPDSLKYAVDDGFKEIVLYENRVTKATTKKLEDDTYETTFTVDSKKTYYSDSGKEIKTDTNTNYIEIGLFGEDITDAEDVPIKNPYYLNRKWLSPGENTFTIITDKKPVKAGIDPYNKLIDRTSGDNLKNVDEL
ncbi:M1 family aminopeptidase [Aquimarina hainanensis]|uniref:M1 family aminopeptidase n=1 Tax=Aquimarina hainanensis TaxID=1578017 RepID=A0ABW5N6A0_9FLAO